MSHPEFDVGDKPGDVFTPEPPARSPRGCLFYGCITALVVSVLGVLMLGAAAYTGYYYLNQMVNDYTSTTPVPVPEVVVTDDQRASIDERWQAFKTAIDKGEATEIVLTADDLNALIQEQPDLKGKVFITLKGEQMLGQISWPLDEIGFPLFKGRFVNGTTSLKVSLDRGAIDVRMLSLTVNGKSPNPDVMRSLQAQNLAKNVSLDDESAAKLRQIESLVVKDSKVYVQAVARRARNDIQVDVRVKEIVKDARPVPVQTDDTGKTPPRDEPEPAEPKPDEPKEQTPQAA